MSDERNRSHLQLYIGSQIRCCSSRMDTVRGLCCTGSTVRLISAFACISKPNKVRGVSSSDLGRESRHWLDRLGWHAEICTSIHPSLYSQSFPRIMFQSHSLCVSAFFQNFFFRPSLNSSPLCQ
jgi:hypothetical protein